MSPGRTADRHDVCRVAPEVAARLDDGVHGGHRVLGGRYGPLRALIDQNSEHAQCVEASGPWIVRILRPRLKVKIVRELEPPIRDASSFTPELTVSMAALAARSP